MTADIMTDIFTAAVAEIENGHHPAFLGGPEAWTAIHRATNDLVTGPAVEAVRQRIPAGQVQFWRADQDTVVKTLQDLAGTHGQIDLLREADADNRIAQARRVIADALGTPDDEGGLAQIARAAADRIRYLSGQVAALNEELARHTREAR